MYLITNRTLCDENRYIEVLKEASDFGVEYIVLREKDLSDDELTNLYYKIKESISANTKIIINNNIDVFNRVDAQGIHLSFNKFKTLYNEGKLPHNKIIGVSLHTVEEVLEISDKEVDYIFLSHIYETKCKEGLSPKGLEILKSGQETIKNTKIKLVALGGILPINVYETLKYCDDVAVMSTIMKSDDVYATLEQYTMCRETRHLESNL